MNLCTAIILMLLGTNGGTGAAVMDRAAAAERFFRGVYACEPAVVDELATAEVVVTYPIFEKLFGKSVLRGRDAVRDFATGFCSRWADAQITIHEAVAEGDRVVLVWSFTARNVGSAREDTPPTDQEHSWGGITLYRFDEAGKIVAEIGEESEPGPIERLQADDATN